MKKSVSIVVGLSLLVAVSTLSGCKSMRRKKNPGGVFGGAYGAGMDFPMDGSIPMGDRFFGGTEERNLFASVYFAYDSSMVPASERAKVELVADYLRQNSQAAVIIEGHCDERGSREYNLALGERRALAVRSYLTGLGITPERIQTKSYGKEMPAVFGSGEEVWSQNRRAEFVIYTK